MNRIDIDNLLSDGNYSDALSNLAARPPSIWRDTCELLCLSALEQDQKALRLANRLYRSDLENKDARLDDPELSNQLRQIAMVFTDRGETAKACHILNALCEKTPNDPALIRDYATALGNSMQLEESEKQLIKALKLQPNSVQSYLHLARVYCQTGRVDAGINCYYTAATLAPERPDILQRIAYWGNFAAQANQQSNYRMARLWADRAHPGNHRDTNVWRPEDPERQLQIGFISADFYAHAISFYIRPLLKALDRAHFQVTAYSDTRHSDKITLAIKGLVDVWRESGKQSNTELAAQIGMDQIDVLIDLSGLAINSRMGVFAKHPAPLQISWLGYPSTTGLESIAYRITDAIADPDPAADRFYSEALLRLENCFLCYQPLSTAPDVRDRPEGKSIVFGSFNDMAKISSLTLDAWAAALHAVANSSLQIKHYRLDNSFACDHLIKEFSDRGIEAERLHLLTSNPKIEEHLEQYNKIDIALDTTPYNGTTTTLEALWMGVPVVSLSATSDASRVTASILHQIGLSRYATTTINDFSKQIRELSGNYRLRSLLKSSLRAKMQQSSLMNHTQFAEDFGGAIREKWRLLCEQRNPRQESELAASASTGQTAVKGLQ